MNQSKQRNRQDSRPYKHIKRTQMSWHKDILLIHPIQHWFFKYSQKICLCWNTHRKPQCGEVNIFELLINISFCYSLLFLLHSCPTSHPEGRSTLCLPSQIGWTELGADKGLSWALGQDERKSHRPAMCGNYLRLQLPSTPAKTLLHQRSRDKLTCV